MANIVYIYIYIDEAVIYINAEKCMTDIWLMSEKADDMTDGDSYVISILEVCYIIQPMATSISHVPCVFHVY